MILRLHRFDQTRLVEVDACLFALEDALARDDPVEAVRAFRSSLREARDADLEAAAVPLELLAERILHDGESVAASGPDEWRGYQAGLARAAELVRAAIPAEPIAN